MDIFDVIIIGAGPAGLKCAETLGGSDLRVLLVEKNEAVGLKPCAGGLTSLNGRFTLPADRMRAFSTQHVILDGRRFEVTLRTPLKTISRLDLGRHQLDAVRKFDNITVRTRTPVREIGSDYVLLQDGERVYFRYLAGADGANSLVRRYLGLRNRIFVGMQYVLPETCEQTVWIFNTGLIGSGYCWIVPHRDFTTAGIYFNPRLLPARQAREALHRLLDDCGIDYRNGRFEGAPINCRYDGVKFGNIFLMGEAAGLVSAATGEGILYALTSGEDVARHILDAGYDFEATKMMLTRKRRQELVRSLMEAFPVLQPILFRLFFSLIRMPAFQRYFSG